MNPLPEHINKKAGSFAANMRECFGDSLRSVVLYGPAARGEESKGTLLSFMVVVADNSPSAIAPCSGFMHRWTKDGIGTPLIVTPDYIADSLDTFPLEFMEMKSAYSVIAGEDMLAGLEFAAEDVRSQCERELKGKLLHLRAEYLTHRGSSKDLAHLVRRSLETFRLVFAGALYLKGIPAPSGTRRLMDAASAAFYLDTTLLGKLHDFGMGTLKPDHEELDRLFDLYVEELDKLSHAIDTFGFTENTQ